MNPCPKPVKREKKKPAGLKSRRWGVRRKARGTAHSRRPRQWGRMSWLHHWRACFVREFFRRRWTFLDNGDTDTAIASSIQDRLLGRVTPCGGPFQVAHLFGRYGEDSDSKTILACRDHHHDIDQTRSWFRILTKPERLWLKTFLAARATLAWDSLPQEERDRWDVIGRVRFGRRAA